MATQSIFQPGEEVPTKLFPSQNSKKALTIGPGLRHIPPSTLVTTLSGPLNVDTRKNAIWIENNSGRYIPSTGDLIIATVLRGGRDELACTITANGPTALLPQLAFEGASKKTRPNLPPGSLVYTRIASASKHIEPELTCISPTTGKADGLGPLKAGTCFGISLSLARRVLLPPKKVVTEGKVTVLEELAKTLAFEVATGRNGKMWVNSDNIKTTLVVRKAVTETDEKGLGIEEQSKLVRKLVATL